MEKQAVPLADHGFQVSFSYYLSDVGVEISRKNEIFQTDDIVEKYTTRSLER